MVTIVTRPPVRRVPGLPGRPGVAEQLLVRVGRHPFRYQHRGASSGARRDAGRDAGARRRPCRQGHPSRQFAHL